MNPVLAGTINDMERAIEITGYSSQNRKAGTPRRASGVVATVLGLCLWLLANTAYADRHADRQADTQANHDVGLAEPRLDVRRLLYTRRAGDRSLGLAWADHHSQTHPGLQASAERLAQAERAASHFRLNSSHLGRHQIDQGTRMTGWKLGDEVFFGKSKGDLSGVALIWQRSQTDQVSLSGSGLRLTRRIN